LKLLIELLKTKILVSVFYTVSPELANGIAKAIGWNQPIEPLEVKSSAQAIAFRHNIGVSADRLSALF